MRSASRFFAWAPVLIAVGFFVVYSVYAVARHYRLETTAFDLGIFAQAVRGYAEFRGPISDLRGWNLNLFGDHFHPIIATLAPLWWLRPKASTLLMAQAALLASSIIPITRLAMKRLGNSRGLAVGIAYGLSWGLQSALAFDFHEVAFGVPLLAFGLVAFLEDRWRTGILFTLALLLVKEDMGATVAAIGAYLMWRRRLLSGITLIVVGVASVLVLALVVIPAFNPVGENWYLHQYGGSASGGGIAGRILSAPLRLFDNEAKVGTLFQLGLITGFVALRSPLAIAAFPNLAIRFLSDNPLYHGTSLQYSLILMPIAFAAFLDAYPKLVTNRVAAVRWYTKRSPLIVLAVAAVLAQHYPLQSIVLEPVKSFTRSPRVESAYALMAKIPDNALVETTNVLAPHLVGRCRVYMYPFVKDVQPDYVLQNPSQGFFILPDGVRERVKYLQAHGYQEIAKRDGYVLLRREQ